MRESLALVPSFLLHSEFSVPHSILAMLLGINYADPNRFGWDFGLPPKTLAGHPFAGPNWAGPPGADGETPFLKVLRTYRVHGLEIVRFPILGDAWNYGSPTSVWDGQDWVWRFTPPPTLDPSFLHDFELLLQTFRKTDGIRLMPVLISFEAFQKGKLVLNSEEVTLDGSPPPTKGVSLEDYIAGRYLIANESTPVGGKTRLDPEFSTDYHSFIKGGKADIVLNKQTRRAFMEQVLQPFLEMAAEYREQIYAFDLCNEPDMLTGEIPQKHLIRFLQEGCETIARYGVSSTVGFQRFDVMVKWAEQLQVALAQFHYYPELSLFGIGVPELPELDGGCLGEFATSDINPETGQEWPGWPGSQMRGRPRLRDRLRMIEEKKFASALLWSDNAGDVCSRWDSQTWSEIGAYLEGSRENGSPA